MMAAYAKYATPGPQHKMLDPLVGSWDCTAQMWNDPSAAPTESKATCETKWVLGGRFTQDDVTGDMGGMPFHGMGINGYDNIKKEFVSFWIDEMSTSFMITTGQSDASGKVNETIAIHIPAFGPLAIVHYKRIVARIRGRGVFLVAREYFSGLGPRHREFLDCHDVLL